MKKKIIFLLAIFTFAVLIINLLSPKENQLSSKEKVDDFESVYNLINEGYPYLDVNKRKNNIDWIENKDKYIKRIEDTKNDKEFINEMSLILSELNNRHTELIDNKDRYEMFKESYSDNGWYDFLDDKKVVDRYNSIKDKIKIPKGIFVKKELILEDVVKDKVGYIYLPSMASRNKTTKDDLKLIGDYINKLEKHKALIIDIRGNLGGSDSYWKGIVSNLIKNDIDINGYRVYRNNCDVVKKYTKVRNRKLENIEKLPIDAKQNAPKEIFEKFTDFERTADTIKANQNTKFNGKIYILIDEKNYSSSESFAMFCKENKIATMVGQTTGGDGGGLDPVLFNLKNSGLIVRMASGMYINKDGVCDEEFKTVPDFIVKNNKRTLNFEDDNCIQKVLKLENVNN